MAHTCLERQCLLGKSNNNAQKKRKNTDGAGFRARMAEHKKQHYVPKSYLRHFSQDGVGLERYSLSNETPVRSNIENTCVIFWFYAKGKESSEFEQMLSVGEAKHAEIIQEILDTRGLTVVSPNGPQDYLKNLVCLHNFILLTATRTELAKNETEAAANALLDGLKPVLAQSKEAKARGITLQALDRVKLRRDTAGLEGMMSAMLGAPLISDLAITLLINESGKPFITSDSPVVFYNSLKLGDMIMSNWQAPGLMIFLPLDEEIALWLFDPPMYKPHVKTSTNDILLLTRYQDVDELNRLQLLNAYKYLIYAQPKCYEYVRSLHRPLQGRRRSALIRAEKAVFDVGDKRHVKLRVGKPEIDYKPHLSFFKIDKSYVGDRKRAYKEHVAKFGPEKPFVRNEALFAAIVAEIRRNIKKSHGIQRLVSHPQLDYLGID
jgi:hypothetical protein